MDLTKSLPEAGGIMAQDPDVMVGLRIIRAEVGDWRQKQLERARK